MKYTKCEGLRKKILSKAIYEHNKEQPNKKISNYANVELIDEDVSTNIYRISFKHQNEEIFHYEINIWDVLLNVL